ncbi:hypothetical protein OAZ88_00545, partial [bacterium]|nr:hypothetical protein [bacterium]
VGDLDFRMKCFKKMQTIKNSTAIIFVSHSKFDISRMCSFALPMHKGSMLSSPLALNDAYNLIEQQQTPNISHIIKFDSISQNIALQKTAIDIASSTKIRVLIKFVSKKYFKSAKIRLIIFDSLENTSIEEIVDTHDVIPNKTLSFYVDLDFSRYRKAMYFMKLLITCSSYLEYLLNAQEIVLGSIGSNKDVSQGKLLSSTKTFMEAAK